MSAAEFAEWLAYDRIDPFGSWREDLRSGIVAATLANVNRGRGRRAFSPSEFMPSEWWKDKTEKARDLARRLGRHLRALAARPKA